VVVDAFGLSQISRQWNIKISINAARVMKNVCHISAGLK
jgi:hypothetical protein